MATLEPMTAEAARRFVAEVGWDERFIATINGTRGFNKISVFSVEELLRVAEGGAAVISGPAFAIWADSVLGDDTLGVAVSDACDGIPLFKQAPIVLELVGARRVQAMQAIGLETS